MLGSKIGLISVPKELLTILCARDPWHPLEDGERIMPPWTAAGETQNVGVQGTYGHHFSVTWAALEAGTLWKCSINCAG